MKVISSKRTFFMKRLFPVLWFGILGISMASALISTSFAKATIAQIVPFLVMPLVMTVFGAFLFRMLIWDLADEVSDGGDYLLVRKSGIEERVSLSEIINVGMSRATNPPRLSLRLRKPGKFGDEIVFIPVRNFTLNPFARNPVAEDLIRRVDLARSGR
jgi:hypothetical protein